MRKILFVCHGNICRSPMAKMILKFLTSDVFCASKATSKEEIGNGIYPPAKDILKYHNIPISAHVAQQVTKEDYDFYDEIYGMDDENIRDLYFMFGSDSSHKIHKLLDRENILDPWFTGNFEMAYQSILRGCKKILEKSRR